MYRLPSGRYINKYKNEKGRGLYTKGTNDGERMKNVNFVRTQ